MPFDHVSWEIDVPRLVLCESHRKRFASFGIVGESCIAAATMQYLIVGGYITPASTQADINLLVESIGHFCCWLGEARLDRIESELLKDQPKH